MVDTPLLYRFPHRHDIFRRDVSLNIVDRVENKSSTGHQVLQAFAYIEAYFVRSMSFVEGVLRIHAAAPETNVLSKITLQRCRIHIRRADLDGIENIHADLDQIGNQWADRST